MGSAAAVEILPVAEEHLLALVELAGVIWRQCYPGIISSAQIDFMLARMYALDVLKDEIRTKGIRFVRLLVNDELVGFASFGPGLEPGEMKLHKCYLLPKLHGRGYGRLLLRHCEREAVQVGARRLVLTVNKHNVKAIAAYQRNGFTKAAAVVVDIGGGFVMDDFVMVKELPASLM